MRIGYTMAAAMAALTLAACGGEKSPGSSAVTSNAPAEIVVDAAELEGNPFLEDWDTPFGVQPFDRIGDEHFMPAFKQGLLELRADIAAITDNPEPPSFDNTILALEKSGELAGLVRRTFSSLSGTELNDTMRTLQREIWPLWTRERDAITLNATLFERIQAVYQQRESLDLNEQQARLLELTHRRFVRAGAALSPEVKQQVSDINTELSTLSTRFGQNLLAATKSFRIELTDEADTAGLADDFKANIWDEDEEAWVLTLDRSVYETFMTQSENRE
ncbi:MAG: M3 family peptidase, partial [Pseudomonadota bacterium]